MSNAIKADSFTVVGAADGGTLLSVMVKNNTTHTIHFTSAQWAKIAESAGWFERNVDQGEALERLARERDQAIAAAGELKNENKRLNERLLIKENEISALNAVETSEEETQP